MGRVHNPIPWGGGGGGGYIIKILVVQSSLENHSGLSNCDRAGFMLASFTGGFEMRRNGDCSRAHEQEFLTTDE